VSLDGPDAKAFGASGCQGKKLPQGGTCQVAVTFDRSTQGGGDGKGNYSARLTITDNAEDSPQAVPLTSSLPPPDVTLNPKGLNFPSDTVTVLNSGAGADLIITNIAFSGTSAADFSVVGNTCGSGVHAGSTCTIQVGFNINAGASSCAELEYCGVMIISDNASGGQQHVPLDVAVIG
jgi:hypothetical protein